MQQLKSRTKISYETRISSLKLYDTKERELVSLIIERKRSFIPISSHKEK